MNSEGSQEQLSITCLKRLFKKVIDDEDSEIIRRIPAVMIAFSDKMISRDDNEEIRRLMSVTKVGQFIYREQRTNPKKLSDKRYKLC